MLHSKSDGVTVTMLHSFVGLSRTLNLSKTCKELDTTRQTVRRHINDLERILGQALFLVESREYSITPFGQASVAGAEAILKKVEKWSGQTDVTNHILNWLEVGHYIDVDGRDFFSQQHPMFRIASIGLPIMKSALAAWGKAQTQIEDPAMDAIRPYLVVYRKGPNGWVFVEVGDSSAYARWFGWTWSRSAIGKLLHEDNVGDDYNEFISGAYERIYEVGGIRLDHIFAHLPKEDSEELTPVSFQRLLMGCVFPDGTPGLGVLVLITNQIEIDALQQVEASSTPEELIMDFEL